jgi:hypothetical protein
MENLDNFSDMRPWITIFPDYPCAFAWYLPPCHESELTSYVGPCYGDVYPNEGRAEMGGEELPEWLMRRFSAWMEKWQDFDMSDKLSDFEENPSDEELAIDNEGIELTRELKNLYGDKYRFRYSYAWRYRDGDWIVV